MVEAGFCKIFVYIKGRGCVEENRPVRWQLVCVEAFYRGEFVVEDYVILWTDKAGSGAVNKWHG
jgi:hypothetical protein